MGYEGFVAVWSRMPECTRVLESGGLNASGSYSTGAVRPHGITVCEGLRVLGLKVLGHGGIGRWGARILGSLSTGVWGS